MTQEEQQQVIQENVQLSSENEHLKKFLGEKDLEIAILRDLVKKKNHPSFESNLHNSNWLDRL